MTKLFTQNAKMKQTSKEHNINLFNFGIPAFRAADGFTTCPNATKCVNGCYAQSGAYAWTPVKKAYEYRLAVTKELEFCHIATQELIKLAKRKKNLVIRVHDSGDFYSEAYLLRWLEIAHATKGLGIHFYAYTKMVSLVKHFQRIGWIPNNFTFIFSYGGSEDHLIDPKHDRHSYVFDSEEKLERNGYANASHDDSIAWKDSNNRIGLCYHGAKSFTNTNWGKVAAVSQEDTVTA